MILVLLLLAFLLSITSSVTEQLMVRVTRTPLRPELKRTVQSAVQAGELTEAEEALVRESGRTPADPEILTLAASIFLADNQALNAAIALKRVEKLRRLTTDEHFTLAMAYVAMKRRAWAREELDSLARRNSSDSRYLYWLARLSYDEGKYADAEQILRKVIALDSSSARAYDNLGLNLEALGRLDEALSAYRSGMALNRRLADRSAWPALNLGTLALRMGKLDEAKAALDEAYQLEPELAQTHYRLGVWHEKAEEPASAIRELQTAVKLDSLYPDPWWALARLLRRRGDVIGADAALAQFQKLKLKK